jgi:hypothetical protein
MTFIPTDLTHMTVSLTNDCNQLKTILAWVEGCNQKYVNMTAANMSNAGISANDQNSINAFLGDLGRLESFLKGTVPGVAGDVRIDIANIMGVA